MTTVELRGCICRMNLEFRRIAEGLIATITNGAELASSATLQIRLLFDSEDVLLTQVDPELLSVLAFDDSTGLRNEIDSTYLHGEMAVASTISKFGAFVLLERGIGVNAGGSRGDSGAAYRDDAGSQDDGASSNDVAASADCGTGACGGGMAFCVTAVACADGGSATEAQEP